MSMSKKVKLKENEVVVVCDSEDEYGNKVFTHYNTDGIKIKEQHLNKDGKPISLSPKENVTVTYHETGLGSMKMEEYDMCFPDGGIRSGWTEWDEDGKTRCEGIPVDSETVTVNYWDGNGVFIRNEVWEFIGDSKEIKVTKTFERSNTTPSLVENFMSN